MKSFLINSKTRKNKSQVLSVLILFIAFIFAQSISANYSYPDSLIFNDEQTVLHADGFDSLYFSSIITKNKYLSNYNPYDYPEDSIPEFSDEIIRQRLEIMNTMSPFDFEFNEEVRNYIIFFSGKRRGLISRALSKADFYFPLFEEMLDKYNLPIELKYLSIVESALNPNAKSRAGAVGLWQFMPSTGRMYGLKYNSQIDERRDMWDATEAACRHFADLYAIYNDWNLVLAAYNAGPGNVNKAIRRSDSATGYWEIYNYLPRETRGYVPAFIAVNYVMTYHIQHNISAADNELPFEYQALDTICINKKMSFSEIAKMSNLDMSTIQELNPQYTRKYVPATSVKPMVITLPNAGIASFIRYRNDILALEN